MNENKEIHVDAETGEVLECPCDRECTEGCSCSAASDCEQGEVNTSLEQDMIKAMENERERGAKRFWRYNHSTHESFSLIREELEESQEALNAVPKSLKEAWSQVRENDDVAFAAYCEQMKKDALAAAGECIQLAAMAQKAAESVYEN